MVTCAEFRSIREKLNLTTEAWGRALGYRGTYSSVARQIRQYESGQRPIPPWIARLAAMYERHGVPRGWR
jgi:transcriptional regulator with XRE-family HTH domain